MSTWLEPLREVLAQGRRPVRFFFRDDDAGWCGERLRMLLDQFAALAVPLDLAIIPDAMDMPLAVDLVHRAERSAGCLGLHQHGYSHVNHEASGRKCEFGPSRTREQQFEDLERGKQILQEHLGAWFDPIFTPPWNRCTDATVACLKDLGFRALSRDLAAAPLVSATVSEVPVSINWARYYKDGVDTAAQRLGIDLARQATEAGVVGIMLHHEVMDAGERATLAELLELLRQDNRAHCIRMRDAVGFASNPTERHVGHG